MEAITVDFPCYYDKLTQLTYGRRFGEIVVVDAGVSVGKTDFVMSQDALVELEILEELDDEQE